MIPGRRTHPSPLPGKSLSSPRRRIEKRSASTVSPVLLLSLAIQAGQVTNARRLDGSFTGNNIPRTDPFRRAGIVCRMCRIDRHEPTLAHVFPPQPNAPQTLAQTRAASCCKSHPRAVSQGKNSLTKLAHRLVEVFILLAIPYLPPTVAVAVMAWP
jgi:hypothetical protein